MAKLPSRETLGATQIRGGGTLARIQPYSPDMRAIRAAQSADVMAQGAVGLAKGVAALGETLQLHARKQDEFETERRFHEFEWGQRLALDKSMREIQPGQARGFADTTVNQYTENAKEFFKDVPEHLKPQYEQKLFRTERDLYGTAATFARQEQKRFSVNGIEETTANVFQPRARIARTDELDTVTGDYDKLVDANPDLTPIEKDELKRKGRRQIGLSHLDALPPDQAKLLAQARAGSSEALLRKFEGFRESAYWDVNAHRAGYGSDTVTRADGTIEKVTPQTRVTREDAERDLARRTKEFQGVAEKQIGADVWAQLPNNAKAGLTSVTYNYGSLPGSVVAAAKSGDPARIADAVAMLPANPDRRRQEADIIRGQSALSSLSDTDWKAVDTAAQTKQTRIAMERGEQIERQIIDGAAGKSPLIDRASIEADPALDDTRRNNLLRQYDRAAGDVVAFQQAMTKFRDPNGGSFNPYNSDDREFADKIYKSMGNDLPALQAVVERTNIVPKSAVADMRGSLASNDPKRVAAAANLATNLLTKNPTIFAGVDGGTELEQTAVKMSQYVERFGMSADDAAKKLIEENTPEYKAKVKARIKTEDINEIVKKKLSIDDMRGAFDESWWPGKSQIEFSPEARQSAYSDYVELFRERYMEHGNIDDAKKEAAHQLKKVWGVSQVTGSDVVMRYPPDRAPAMAGIEDAPGKIAMQASEAIKGMTGEDVPRDKIRFAPMPGGQTARPYVAGQPAPYMLSWFDKNGTLQMLNPGQAFVADPVAMREKVSAERRAAFDASRASADAIIGGSGEFGPELQGGFARQDGDAAPPKEKPKENMPGVGDIAIPGGFLPQETDSATSGEEYKSFWASGRGGKSFRAAVPSSRSSLPDRRVVEKKD